MQQASAARGAALVVGGPRGIGAAAVQRLAADSHAVAFTSVLRPDSARALVAQVAQAAGLAHAIAADPFGRGGVAALGLRRWLQLPRRLRAPAWPRAGARAARR